MWIDRPGGAAQRQLRSRARHGVIPEHLPLVHVKAVGIAREIISSRAFVPNIESHSLRYLHDFVRQLTILDELALDRALSGAALLRALSKSGTARSGWLRAKGPTEDEFVVRRHQFPQCVCYLAT